MSTSTSTQTAIVLVTDLVGSTELRGRVGEEAAEELRRAHDRLLAEAVVANGGEVVKGLGDGVLARFIGAADAVAAAVQIQQAGTRHDFDIRVGISAGDITVEEGDVFGTPVIEASRLCAQAGGGQILVAQLVQMLARGRGGHAFTSLGELALKGLAEPVATAEVGWEPLPAEAAPSEKPTQAPLQPALAVDERFAYAGRTRERAALEVAWKRAATGDRRAVLLSGEPGMGKTRLATELARAVHANGATVLLGRADEDLNSPYRPLADALRHLVSHAPTETLEEHARAHGDALVRLVPELLRRVPDAHPAPPADDERMALFDAAIDLLGRRAAVAPVLLILDDLHWADHPTLLFLRHLTRSAPAMALLVVGTYRDTDLSREHPLAAVLADLRREPSVERVAMAGLDGAEVAELMTAAAGHDLDEPSLRLARVIHEETSGNPFFIGEVLTHLAESGVIYERDGRWTSAAGVISHVPDGVREVIGRRLSALGKEADKALRTAAAVGAEFDVEVLARVLGEDEDDLIDVLDEPLGRRLIAEVPGAVGRFRFAHALVRQALYEELSALRRSRLHVRILDVLREQGCREATLLAHHACEAAAGGSAAAAQAVELASAAASEATTQLALEEAVRWYERALEAEEAVEERDPRRRARVLIAMGRAMNAIGHVKEACDPLAEAAALARAVDDIDLFCDAAVDYAMGAGAWIDPDDQLGPALVDEALARLGEGESALRARLLLTSSWWYVLSDHALQVRLTAEALDIARRAGDRRTLQLALGARSSAILAAPDMAELDSIVAERRAMLDDATPTRDRLSIHVNTAIALIRRGDLTGAARCAVEFAEDAIRLRSPMLRYRATTVAGGLDLLAGRVDEARAKLADAEAIELGTGEGWTTVTGTFAFNISSLCDPPEEHIEAWQRMVDAAPAFFRVFPGRNVLLAGRVGDGAATAELTRWAEAVFPLFPPVYRPAGFNTLSSSWRVLGSDLAAKLHRELLPYEGQWLMVFPETVFGAADLHLARFDRAAGRVDAAVARYESALVEHERAGEVPYRAHIAYELAATLRERLGPGDRDRARGLAEEALRVATEIGLRGLAPMAEALL